MNDKLDFVVALGIARKEADREIDLSWPPNLRCSMDIRVRADVEELRKKRVVRKFLERICPVDVPEAQSILNNQAGSSDR